MTKYLINVDQTEIHKSLKELSNIYKAIGGNLEYDLHNIGRAAVEETAEIVASHMYMYVPKSTGELAASITIEKAAGPGEAKIGESGVTVSVGKGLYRPYHYFQEVGSRRHIVPASYLHSPYGGYMGYAMAEPPWDPNPNDSRLRMSMSGGAVYGRPKDRKGFREVSNMPQRYVERAFQKGATHVANISFSKKNIDAAIKKRLAKL